MEKKIFVLGLAGAESIVFSFVIYMAVTASILFRPMFGAGEDYAVASVIKPICVIVAFGFIHHWTQRYLNANRPGVISTQFVAFDYVTSFMPIVVLIWSFIQMRATAPAYGYAAWWNWNQFLYAIVVIWATSDDIVPTIRFWNKGRA